MPRTSPSCSGMCLSFSSERQPKASDARSGPAGAGRGCEDNAGAWVTRSPRPRASPILRAFRSGPGTPRRGWPGRVAKSLTAIPERASSASAWAARSAASLPPFWAGILAASVAGSRSGCTGTPSSPASTRAAWSRWAGSRSRTRTPPVPTDAFSSALVPSAITRPWSMTAMRSASRSASSRYCVVSTTVVPCATIARTISHTWLRLRGSRPVVGSSRKSSSGVTMMLAATSSLRRMPPENCRT